MNIRFYLKMLLVDSTFLRETSIVFLLQLLLLQVGLDVHPHPPLLLFHGGVLVCVPVVAREILKLKKSLKGICDVNTNTWHRVTRLISTELKHYRCAN